MILKEEDVKRNSLPVNAIIHGDAINVLKKLKKESIDLVLTDPPYNISQKVVIKRNGGKFGIAKDISYDFGEWDHNQITPYDWLPVVYELLKEYGVLIFFYDKKEISCIAKWLEKEFNMKIRHIGVWVKTNPPPQARKVKWMDATEFFLIATKNHGAGHHYNWQEGQHPDYIVTPICMGKERLGHPTQKPEKVIEPLIRWWSYEGDIILDPFLGVGTTAYVALKLNRMFIGIEINEEYCKRAEARIEPILKQDKLTSFY